MVLSCPFFCLEGFLLSKEILKDHLGEEFCPYFSKLSLKLATIITDLHFLFTSVSHLFLGSSEAKIFRQTTCYLAQVWYVKPQI